MDGLKLTQAVFRGLRRPAETALPYRDILASVRSVVARKKFDLALSPHNSTGMTTEWFTPSSGDFPLEDLGFEGGVLLPIRIETRGLDSDWETGEEVPIVNHDVLNTSVVGAASFYGSPMRLAFRDPVEYLIEREFRLVYEPDFTDTTELGSAITLPDYVEKMIEVEAKYDLVDQVEDNSPEWMNFMKSVVPKWEKQIADWRTVWDRYVGQARGKHTTPKRTFWQNRGVRTRTKYFKD